MSDNSDLIKNIAIGVAAVLGGLVLYKVIKNDDSVEGAARDLKGQAKGAFKDAKGEAKGAYKDAKSNF
ncbi:hypothetical protein CVIRNUC_006030 [Coccomyxa viridis]|uniref:G2250 protein n=2 Tax=Coccomyxa viridis TaxID=1274662 RepID=A0ABP1FJX4_9CHLO|nr:hypothetical protein CVIRNUC_006030 [Coccomyxa viridis]